MSRITYVSVVELGTGEREIRLGKADHSGRGFTLPTPENDHDDIGLQTWERVGVFTLPDPMPKSDFQDWWNDNVHDDPQPSPIPEVLAAMDADDGGDA